MAESASARVWFMRLAFVGLALAIIFVHLIPLDLFHILFSRLFPAGAATGIAAPPDLLIAFAFAWVLRRPDFVPPVLIALVMLLADLLFQRPPGLWALLVVLGAEYLKYRTAGLSEASFIGEWISVALVVTGVTLLNRLLLGMLLVPLPAFGLAIFQMVLTILVYPLVTVVTQVLLGVRRPVAGDGGALGVRG